MLCDVDVIDLSCVCAQLPVVDDSGDQVAAPEFGFSTGSAAGSGAQKPALLSWQAIRHVGAGFWLTDPLVCLPPVMPCCAVLCCAVPCCAMLCHADLYFAVLCHAVLCSAMLCHAVPCHAVQCCVMLCCAVPCCAVLCYAALCCAMQLCAMLCCTAPCCVMLCPAAPRCRLAYCFLAFAMSSCTILKQSTHSDRLGVVKHCTGTRNALSMHKESWCNKQAC